MSEERMRHITAYRTEAKRLEADKKVEGKLIDGIEMIEKALASREAKQAVPVPVMIAGSRQNLRAGERFPSRN